MPADAATTLPATYEVTAAQLARFGAAVGGSGWRELDSAAFVAALTLGLCGELMAASLADQEPAVHLHAAQQVSLHRPVVAGDRLRCTAAVNTVRPAAGGTLAVIGVGVRDALRDTEVATTAATLVRQPPGAGQPSESTARPAQPGVGLRPSVFRVNRADVAAYADAAGDHNPIHIFEDAARAAGLPGVIAHGMLLFAQAARYLTETAQPKLPCDLMMRFQRPVVVPTGGAAVVISGWRDDQHDRLGATVSCQDVTCASLVVTKRGTRWP